MSTSRRGVMTARTGRSPSRITPAIMVALARFEDAGGFRLGHQGADFLVGDARPWGSASMAEQTQQRAAGDIEEPDQRRSDFAIQVIAGATRTAICSGLRSAICFGTSSPTISET